MVYIADQVTKLRFGQAVTWEALDVAVWKADEKGEWNYVSPALLEMIGAFKEDMMGLAWVNRIVQEDRDRIFRSWKFSLDVGSDFDETYSYKKGDGMYQKVSVVGMHSKDDNGKVVFSHGWFIKVGEPYTK